MAKECYLEIDGKRTKLTNEQLKALGLYEEPKKSPFDRVEKEKSYYLIDNCGCVASIRDYCWGQTKQDMTLQTTALIEKLCSKEHGTKLSIDFSGDSLWKMDMTKLIGIMVIMINT